MVMLMPGAESHEIYPNPAGDQIYVKWDSMLYQNLHDIFILNVLGQTKGTPTNVEQGSCLPVDDLSNGFYGLAIQQDLRLEYRNFFKD